MSDIGSGSSSRNGNGGLAPSSIGPSLPPDTNPIQTVFESFNKDTPTVTKLVMTIQVVSWFISWFVDLTFAIANIPYFTIQQFEMYRLVTNLLWCNSFFNLVFTYFSFVPTGRHLETSIGSTAFGLLFLGLGVTSNIIYVVVAALLDALFMDGTQYFFILPSFGIWIVLFGILALECSSSSRVSSSSPPPVRRLLLFEMPTRYYPVALLGIFTLLSSGGFQLGYVISIGLGYLIGFGYLDTLKIPNDKIRRWEEQALRGFTSLDGWVSSTSLSGGAIAIAGGSWNEDGNSQQQSSGIMSSLFMRSGTATTALQDRSEGSAADDSPIPQSGGRQLGSGRPSKRTTSNADAREARLKAIERRMMATTGSAGSGHGSGDSNLGEESV